MSDVLEQVVAAAGEQLVLVDVGASGGTPRLWRGALAKHATFVGFDPDAREIRESVASDYARAVYIPKAVTDAASSGGDVRFYLTRSPYCSSTLKPNHKITESFLSAESFLVEGEARAAATTVAEALRSLGLSHVDWLKVDTQGTDLRIFKSLPDEMRARVLAVDVEPGLRGAYVGEELFSDVHGVMLREGLWLSRCDVLGFPRMRKATLDVMAKEQGLTEALIAKAVRKTPGWVECRYLRTLESLAERDAPRRDYLLLWAFAYQDEQYGYCLDVALEFAKRFAGDALPPTLKSAALAQIRAKLSAEQQKEKREKSLLSRVKRKIKRII